MDPRRFDTLSKTLSTSGTRRGVLAALLAGSLGLLGLPQPAQGRKRRGGGGGGVTIQGPCGDGSGADNTCRRAAQCCTGICEGSQPGKPKRCRCRRQGQQCTKTRNCCQGGGQALVCEGGTCQPAACDPACGACERCVRGACEANPGQAGTCCAGGTGVCAGGACETCATGQGCEGGACCTAAGHEATNAAPCCGGLTECGNGVCKANCCAGVTCGACQRCEATTGTCVEDESQAGTCCEGASGVCAGGTCEMCDGATPICDAGQCVECTGNRDCTTFPNSYCDTTTGSCACDASCANKCGGQSDGCEGTCDEPCLGSFGATCTSNDACTSGICACLRTDCAGGGICVDPSDSPSEACAAVGGGDFLVKTPGGSEQRACVGSWGGFDCSTVPCPGGQVCHVSGTLCGPPRDA